MGRKELRVIKGFESNPRSFINLEVKAELINSDKEICERTFKLGDISGTDIDDIVYAVDIALWLEDTSNPWYCNRILHIEADIEYD